MDSLDFETKEGKDMLMQAERVRDQIRFLKEHPELGVVISDKASFKKIQEGETLDDIMHEISPEAVDAIWEELEVSILVRENPDAKQNAKSVAVTGSETLAGRVMIPLIEALKNDPRCRELSILTDNLAAKAIRAKAVSDFQRLDDHTLPFMAEIPGPLDASVVVIDPEASPTTIMLFNAKTSFSKENGSKLYFLVSGWQGFGGMHSFLSREHIETPDGFFVGDEFSKLLVENDLKRFPEGHPWRSVSSQQIYITGNELTDDVSREDPDKMTEEARKKLGIDDGTLSVLYLGDIAGAYTKEEGYDVDPPCNQKTFLLTRDAIMHLAEQYPNKKIAFLVRPHPADSRKEELMRLPENALPKNISIVQAGKDDISYTGALYAADVVLSIVSTGNFEAQLRGRKGIYLGYQDKLGDAVLEKVYGRETMQKINNIDNLGVVASPEDLQSVLSEIVQSDWRPENKKTAGTANSAKSMADIILGEKINFLLGLQ